MVRSGAPIRAYDFGTQRDHFGRGHFSSRVHDGEWQRVAPLLWMRCAGRGCHSTRSPSMQPSQLARRVSIGGLWFCLSGSEGH
eukprot:2939420-Karenia_brevis.AAC.1